MVGLGHLGDEEVGARRLDRDVEGAHQPALVQRPAAGQLVAHGDALSGNGGREDEVHVGKDDAAFRVGVLDAGRCEPARPVLEVAEMQKVGAQHVLRPGQATYLVEQARAAERRELNLAEHLDGMVRPVAEAKGDEHVGFGIGDLVEPARRQNAQRHVGIHIPEAGDVRAEPERREARRAGDAEGAADPLAGMLLRGVAEHGQRLPHVERITAAARRQRHALADALQEVEAEIAFEEPELMADRAAGEMQFVGGAPHAAMPRETVQCAKRLCRWNSQLVLLEVNGICARAGKHITF